VQPLRRGLFESDQSHSPLGLATHFHVLVQDIVLHCFGCNMLVDELVDPFSNILLSLKARVVVTYMAMDSQ
jgi:hypothetical protein